MLILGYRYQTHQQKIWVTVTGTLDGKDATSFDDLKGVDPWYNGSNPNNIKPGTGNSSSNKNNSGIVPLSKTQPGGQTFNGNHHIITANFD